jgi:hypothetical protein
VQQRDDVANGLRRKAGVGMAAATGSMSALVTRSTGLSPSQGERWTRCIDPQFCRRTAGALNGEPAE